MNRIINGKRYDTETAKSLLEDRYSGPRDFRHWVETLYQKRTGEFFLHGVGGPMSRYARTTGQNEWSGGEKLIPMSVDAAKAWVEEHGTADEYDEVFNSPVEDLALNVNIREDLAAKLKSAAAERGTTMRAVIEGLLETL